jgi:hypothetical protein
VISEETKLTWELTDKHVEVLRNILNSERESKNINKNSKWYDKDIKVYQIH